MNILVATRDRLLFVGVGTGAVRDAAVPAGSEGRIRPTCLAADPLTPGRAWCGTVEDGLWRSDDAGRTWRSTGLEGVEITSVSASPVEADLVWAGTEPSALWRTADAGASWGRAEGLDELPSSSEWSFPPRPDTHHVRWIACHPRRSGRLWLAVEAGALVTTPDGGRTWHDRVPGGPYDTHELAIHPEKPDELRVAAGDGYFESRDGGATWESPMDGLEVGYLRSVAIDPGDPDVVLVSGASHAHAAYVAGRSDGRLYRREAGGGWERIRHGWPDPPATIAPLLTPGRVHGELWAADERGVHRTEDGGRRWERVAALEPTPAWLRGLVVVDRTRLPELTAADRSHSMLDSLRRKGPSTARDSMPDPVGLVREDRDA